MPVIELSVRQTKTHNLQRPGTAPLVVPVRRLFARSRLGTSEGTVLALLDTGAPLTFVDYYRWLECDGAGEIDWGGAAHAEPASQLPTAPLLGHRIPYRVGHIRIRLWGACGCPELDLGAVPVACIEYTPTVPNCETFLATNTGAEVLLGMHQTFRERTLQLQATADGARWAASLAQPE